MNFAEFLDIRYWAGTEESLASYLISVKELIKTGGGIVTGGQGAASVPGEEDVPRLFSQVGNVGVIRIAGSLTNSDSPYLKYYGMSGYQEIRAALVYAANNADIGAIVLDINSGGGAVAGVSDTADLISAIDSKVKPIHAFSDGGMMSAAYWLGVSARDVTLGRVAEAGSIGVLTVHMEQSKMLQDLGVTPTVIRSGKYKALGNPYEPLSATATAEIQNQVDTLAGMFTQHVADSLGQTYQAVDTKMGQGRVFIGQAAVDIGLAQKVSSFDTLISKVQGGIDKQKEPPKYGANLTKGQPVKTALTEQQIAALALAGTAGTVAEGAAPGATAEGAPAGEPAAATPAPVAEDKPAAAAPAAPAANELVTYLQGQLAAEQAKGVQASIEIRDLKAASELMTASHTSMREIVEGSVASLRVALGQSASSFAGVPDMTLLAEHGRLMADFKAKFKAGGVASTAAADTEDKKTPVQEDPNRARRLAATSA